MKYQEIAGIEGWCLFECEGENHPDIELQRCDDVPSIFTDDGMAREYVVRRSVGPTAGPMQGYGQGYATFRSSKPGSRCSERGKHYDNGEKTYADERSDLDPEQGCRLPNSE